MIFGLSNKENRPNIKNLTNIKIKVDRVIKLAKAARTEMVQLSTGDLELEEQVNQIIFK